MTSILRTAQLHCGAHRSCFLTRYRLCHRMSLSKTALISALVAVSIQLFLCCFAQAQQPALFVAGQADGVGSSSTISTFDLTQPIPQGTPIATVPGFASGLACGPDGNLYVALSGYSCCSPARQAWRVSLDGKTQTKVLDFDTTTVTALQSSGGPEGLKFGPNQALFFNTLTSHQGTLFATGVWRSRGSRHFRLIPRPRPRSYCRLRLKAAPGPILLF